jgi:hypothetical protein
MALTATMLAKSDTEHAHQVALFAYAAVARVHGWEAANLWNKGDMLPVHVGEPDQIAFAIPELKWLHAIPNGGSRGDTKSVAMRRGASLVAEGVRSGVADIFLPVKRGQWSGLYIEMKRPALRPKVGGKGKGGLSNEQIEFASFVKSEGFGWVCCYGWEEAVEVLRGYLEWTDNREESQHG